MNRQGKTTGTLNSNTSGSKGNNSQRGSNVPTQPSVPKMPSVKPNTSKK